MHFNCVPFIINNDAEKWGELYYIYELFSSIELFFFYSCLSTRCTNYFLNPLKTIVYIVIKNNNKKYDKIPKRCLFTRKYQKLGLFLQLNLKFQKKQQLRYYTNRSLHRSNNDKMHEKSGELEIRRPWPSWHFEAQTLPSRDNAKHELAISPHRVFSPDSLQLRKRGKNCSPAWLSQRCYLSVRPLRAIKRRDVFIYEISPSAFTSTFFARAFNCNLLQKRISRPRLKMAFPMHILAIFFRRKRARFFRRAKCLLLIDSRFRPYVSRILFDYALVFHFFERFLHHCQSGKVVCKSDFKVLWMIKLEAIFSEKRFLNFSKGKAFFFKQFFARKGVI